MDAKGLLQFQVNGSFKMLTDIAQSASDAEWKKRSSPRTS